MTYTLENSTLTIDYRAKSDKAAVVNLTNHTYFNLADHDGGALVYRMEGCAYTLRSVSHLLTSTHSSGSNLKTPTRRLLNSFSAITKPSAPCEHILMADSLPTQLLY